MGRWFVCMLLLSGCASGGVSPADLGTSPSDGTTDGQVVRFDRGPHGDAKGVDSTNPGPDTLPAETITVTQPVGGESWATGSKQTILWTSTTGGDPVDITLLKGGSKHSDIAKGIPDKGNYAWSISTSIPPGSDYKIQVTDAADPKIFGVSPAPFSIVSSQYRRPVAIDATKATTVHKDYQVLITLAAASFDYSHAAAGGADLRFASSATPGGTYDLAHWIESWSTTGQSKIWVKVPSIPAGTTTTIYMFYGKAGATSTSSKSATFPKQYVSAGSQTLGGTQTYDWFELKAGHTLTLSAGQVLTINAPKIIIAGAINGTGKGNAGGTSSGAGKGPGGGAGASVAGGGGGGYGNSGGMGGYDGSDNPGAGGIAYGSMVSKGTELGSGGGAGSSRAGGAGGGGVAIVGHDVQISASITMNGTDGAGGAQSGGGGSGGGIMIQGYLVSVAGSLSVRGGTGGSGSITANDGGGGGAGGRIKIFHQGTLSNTASLDKSGGAGGKYGDKAYGQAGGTGSSYVGQTSYDGLAVSVGAEQAF